jgi:hypothetical protein
MSSSLIVTNPIIIKALEMAFPKPPPKMAVGRPRIDPEIIKALDMTFPKPPPKMAVGRPRIDPEQKLLNKIASKDRWRENNRVKVLLDNRIRSAHYYSIEANKIKAKEYYKNHYIAVASC